MITVSPDSHTLYVQRARARFLAGDPTGALADLDEAEKRCPNDQTITRLRADIREGKKPAPVSLPQQPAWKDDVAAANNALASGNAGVALERYGSARRAGLLPVFATINEAMAQILLGEPKTARDNLEAALPTITGPFVRVQAFALLALCDAVEQRDGSERLTQLSETLGDLRLIGSRFELADSALQYLALGFYKRHMLTGSVGTVFDLLQGGQPR